MKLKVLFITGIIIALIFLNACSTEEKDKYYYCEEFWVTTAYFNSVPRPSESDNYLSFLSYKNNLKSHMVQYDVKRSKVTRDVIYKEFLRLEIEPKVIDLYFSIIDKRGCYVLIYEDTTYTFVMYIEKLDN